METAAFEGQRREDRRLARVERREARRFLRNQVCPGVFRVAAVFSVRCFVMKESGDRHTTEESTKCSLFRASKDVQQILRWTEGLIADWPVVGSGGCFCYFHPDVRESRVVRRVTAT